MCSSVRRNPLRINLHVWFYFIVFLTILYNTCETGHIESIVLLSLSASCLNMRRSFVHTQRGLISCDIMLRHKLSM